MRKKTKALSGASQDAYFRRVLKAYPGLSPEERDKLVGRLRAEIAQLRVRVTPNAEADARQIPVVPASGAMAVPDTPPVTPAVPAATIPSPPLPPPIAAFDPFSPNVIVIVRKSGRAAALAALDAIDSLDNLRALAHEQRLSLAPGLASAAELRAAIVTAAERRIANRMAAAG
jgi:hypothetical protein